MGYKYTQTNSYDVKYLWHVVPGVLFDDGDDLTQLLEQVLPHVPVTRTDDTQEWRHHLSWVCMQGGGGLMNM